MGKDMMNTKGRRGVKAQKEKTSLQSGEKMKDKNKSLL